MKKESNNTAMADFIEALLALKAARARCVAEGYGASLLDQIQRGELSRGPAGNGTKKGRAGAAFHRAEEHVA